MLQDYDDISLEEWASFNFEAAESSSDEQTALPDALTEEEGEDSDAVEEATASEVEQSEDSASEEAGSLTAPPAYQGLRNPDC